MRKQGSGIAALLDESPKGRNKGFGKKSMDANESEIFILLLFLFIVIFLVIVVITIIIFTIIIFVVIFILILI